ncbi:alpha/beta fold hydrolase [Kribbella sandramycini]|uniref:Alpha/beta fold hydrolase n=1 Tax=Kribbella sandramycini TaxID=60450 RepID=A0A7Y4L4X6_9ACTN|nr:alpha/beta hydrolase [Kribbella sandramycini]MBB6571771.1 pimeloyl-ACP methyl ester carboxylesterase [Kribbella sandramycini]NOL44414.1 alpha/beta fold hydrolase [Kribbella sandramycini]
MNTTVSKDGTTIAYDRRGSGPALVLVDGALCSRAQGPMPELAELLADRFTVYNYDRRGRGDSGDASPGGSGRAGEASIDRELEDLAAVIEVAGGSAYVYGTSSGAALALAAANAGLPIERVVAFETPFVVDGSRKPMPETFVADLEARGPADAVKYFLTKGVGLPGPMVTLMRLMPAWKQMTAVAHTLPYDGRFVAHNGLGRSLDAGQWSAVGVPVLTVIGGKSPAWMKNAVAAVTAAVPGAECREVPGQNHMIAAKAIAPVIAGFCS